MNESIFSASGLLALAAAILGIASCWLAWRIHKLRSKTRVLNDALDRINEYQRLLNLKPNEAAEKMLQLRRKSVFDRFSLKNTNRLPQLDLAPRKTLKLSQIFSSLLPKGTRANVWEPSLEDLRMEHLL